MTRDGGPARNSVDILARRSGLLWVAALVFFGAGDLVTTIVGLRTGLAAEVGPVAGEVVRTHGLGSLPLLKGGTLAAFYGLWRVTPRPHNLGIPLALVVLGVGVTAWNLVVLYRIALSLPG